MKKGLIIAALMGLVVFAGCFHNTKTPATDSSSSATPATDSATK